MNQSPVETKVPIWQRGLRAGLGLGMLVTPLAACDGEHDAAVQESVTSDAPAATSSTIEATVPTTIAIVPNTKPTNPETGLANPAAKLRAEQIISTFENSTTDIQYGYAEKLDDGRGITAGRAGFTSGTSDLLMVVERYSKETANPNSPLLHFLPALKAVDGTDSTTGLDGFVGVWEQTSQHDPALNKAQDEVYDELYFNPAMRRAEAAGVKTAIGQLIILDTIIQHGEGDDPDGLPAILQETEQLAGSPINNEVVWLQTFLSIRRKHLMNAADPDTREDWRESVSRVDALLSILKSGNLDLNPPLHWDVYGDPFTLNS